MASPGYAALLARLLPARRFGVVLGVERMRALLDRLGAPDERMGTVVHVGGTNGKGSTVAMIAALARAGGVRVAAYTSPHLTSLRERIAIDGRPFSEESIVAAAAAVQVAGGDALTFFEQLTAIACVAIEAAEVDVTILEVGLGGRLDATNAVRAPIAVVTGVAMDHEAVLGSELAQIAAEKAGIFKRGQHVVIGASGLDAATPVLIAAAHAAGAAAVTVVDRAAIASVPPVTLLGSHQRANAAAAVAALEALEAVSPWRVGDAARAAALATVVHPGRFEIVPPTGARPRMILDGAHNPHGAAALAATLMARNERGTCVLAVSADKDVVGIVRALAPAVARFVATQFQQERTLAPAALAAVIREITGAPVGTADSLAAALELTRGHPLIVIAGSLFLVGEARALLLDAPVDPVRLSDPAATPVS